MSVEDQSSATKVGDNPTKSSDVSIAPYSLFASDNPGALITAVILNGENYNEWASEMTNALRAKRKTGFIDGTISKPVPDDPNLELWLSVNSMIVGWIRTSIEPRVRSTVTFIQDAHKLWENLRKRFSVGNKVRVHQVKAKLAACRQDGQAVIDYFGRLSLMWEELDTYKPIPVCTCGAASEFEKERDEEKIHQFVMGLDESRFGSVCTNIISADPTPDIGEVYSKIIQEETRGSSSRDREQQQSAVGFVAKKDFSSELGNSASNRTRSLQCNHCGRTGHEKESCWQLVGFPDWWEERSPNRGAGCGATRGGRGRGGSVSDRPRNATTRANAAHATSSNSSTFPEFTQEQWKAQLLPR